MVRNRVKVSGIYGLGAISILEYGAEKELVASAIALGTTSIEEYGAKLKEELTTLDSTPMLGYRVHFESWKLSPQR